MNELLVTVLGGFATGCGFGLLARSAFGKLRADVASVRADVASVDRYARSTKFDIDQLCELRSTVHRALQALPKSRAKRTKKPATPAADETP